MDTGATFLVVPRALADRLELRPTRTCPIQLATSVETPLTTIQARDGGEVYRSLDI